MINWIKGIWMKLKPVLSYQIDVLIDKGVPVLAKAIEDNKAELIKRLNEFNGEANAEYVAKILKDYKNRQL
jgi:hypothetical protein